MKLPRYLVDGSVLRGQRRAGRGLSGRIEIRHKGGGHAQNFRIIDFTRVAAPESVVNSRSIDSRFGDFRRMNPRFGDSRQMASRVPTSIGVPPRSTISATASSTLYATPVSSGPIKDKVLQIGYDPNRTARIAKVAGDSSNQYKLIIAPDGLQPGDIITASRGKPESLARLSIGDAYPLSTLPIGTMVHCIERYVGGGAWHARSAGTYCTLIRRNADEAILKSNAKKEFTVPVDCLAVIGRVSNINHRNEIIGKAGRSRWLGRRPKGQTGKDRWLHKKKVR